MQNLLRRLPPLRRRYYLDYAAATPLLPAAAARLQVLSRTCSGNPSSIHAEGQRAARALSDARRDLARVLLVQPEHLTFTGSGTEANNLAISGYLEAQMETGVPLSELEVVTSPIEHPSVLEVLECWRGRGLTVRYVAPDETGRIAPSALAAVLNRKTVLVTLAYANSEIGVVQPIRKLARILRSYEESSGTTIVFHVDASQAALWLPCQLPHLGADMMTLDAGKCHGPKGVGVLVRHGTVALAPVIHGGGQEGGLRSGTENVPGIAAAVVALTDAQQHREARSRRILPIAQSLADALLEALPGAVLNGPAFSPYETLERLPHNVHLSIPGLDTEYAVVVLDTHGVAAGTRSACSGKGGGESVVVREISGNATRARSTIRFTLDPNVSPKVVRTVTRILVAHRAQMLAVDPSAL